MAYSNALNKSKIKTSIMISHNKNTNDYSKHISALTAAGGDALAIISDINLGGDQIIKLYNGHRHVRYHLFCQTI